MRGRPCSRCVRRRWQLFRPAAAAQAVLRRALAPRGTLVVVGGEGGKGRLGFVAKENADDLVALKDLIEAGKVTPLIDRTFSLEDVPNAMTYLLGGRGRKGKIVIAV